ncbi:unnamed protein product [Linum trigynum]|uniref:Cytochrome P450 n=1 Tax=Linum trigynum TaxID=586398 RepID=A0AAV2D0I8_9ROSI
MISSSSSFAMIPFLLLTLSTILVVSLLFLLKPKKPIQNRRGHGNLHQMVGDQPHRRLADLARKHGPDVIRLQLGELPYIVISTPEAAKLVMNTHDVAFASRPLLLAPEIVYYGRNDIGFSPYGPYWRQMRKICSSAPKGSDLFAT